MKSKLTVVVALLLSLSLLFCGCVSKGNPGSGSDDGVSSQSGEVVNSKDIDEASGINSGKNDINSENGLTGSEKGDGSYEPGKSGLENKADGSEVSGSGSNGKENDGNNDNGSDNVKTCSISIECSTVLDNMEKLAKGKDEIIPKDGIILSETEIVLEGEMSVFDVLLKAVKDNKIHMEFTNTPVYDSAYIEGIANIYEFECGDLSGWMYSVNGEFPNVGCSSTKAKDGDKIEWRYTCDLGTDIGNIKQE